LETMFDEIKESLGLKIDNEVVRYLIKNHGSMQVAEKKPEDTAPA